MIRALQIGLSPANSVPERVSPKRNEFQCVADMMDVAKQVWPRKTAANLAASAHVSERAAQFWLAGKTGMTIAAARELMRGPNGFEFLVAWLGEDCDAPWFKRCKLAHELGTERSKMRAAEKRFSSLKVLQQQLADEFDRS